MDIHGMAVGTYGNRAVAVSAIQARSFGQNSFDCVGARVAKGIRFAYRDRCKGGMNGIEKRRSAGGFSAVMRNFQEVRGEFVPVP
jgi:hypothetical protein